MSRLRSRSSTPVARGLAALLVTVAVCRFGPANGNPGDIFSSPAPVIGAEAPKAADVKDGDASVATQTGAAQYAYPIQVPPGRNGAAPSLSLSYSSQAPIYGGLAAGWSLSIPDIREDTSQGRLRTHSPEVEAAQADPKADDRFVSALAGGRRLVKVTEPAGAEVYATYRAQNDASFTRYQRIHPGQRPFRWRALASDGSTMLFGQTSRVGSCNISDGFAPLTGTLDAFGNEVSYEYESPRYGECRIKKISWGNNFAASVTDFAAVVFAYTDPPTCNGSALYSGGQLDYRTGVLRQQGASKLTSITATAFAPGSEATPAHTRVVTLGYSATSESCSAPHGPLRLLTSIQESAWGTDSPRVDLPAVTFEYGDPATNLTASTTRSTPWGVGEDIAHKHSLGWGLRYVDDRWPTVEGMMLDIDGDGLLDRVSNASTPGTDGVCQVRWQRNNGRNWPSADLQQFGPPQYFTLPRLKWNGTTTGNSSRNGAATADTSTGHLEGCALNGQVTAYRNSNDASFCHPIAGQTNTCVAGSDPNNPGPYCSQNGTDCPLGGGGGPSGAVFRSYLAYRWMDMDNDGLVDLVAAVHGDIDRYDIGQGNTLDENLMLRPAEANYDLIVNNTAQTPLSWPACPAVTERCKTLSAACMAPARSCASGADCVVNWSSINACLQNTQQQGCHGLIDDVSTFSAPGGDPQAPTVRAPYERCQGLYPWFIYKNQGNGSFAAAPTIKYQPLPLESDTGDSSVYGPGVVGQNHGILDFDGDGVADAIAHPRNLGGTPFYWWFVWLGDGTGGFLPKRYTFLTRETPNNTLSKANTSMQSIEGLFDINGDGLPEHWRALTGLNANVAFHDGTSHMLIGGSGGNPPQGTGTTSPTFQVRPASDALTSNLVYDTPDHPTWLLSGTSTTTNRTADVDGDGRPDVLQLSGNTRTVFYNAGGHFIVPGTSYTGNTGFTRTHLGIYNVGFTPPSLQWKLVDDLIDLDGDGIAEAASLTGGNLVRTERDPALAPPRLLIKVHTGRGLHTMVNYASMHNSTVVEQHPELAWSDGRPKSSPSNQWVVRSVTTHDDFPSMDSTASYFYKNPRHGADDEGRYSFRGFEEIVSTSPSGAKSVQRFGYTAGAAGGDWSGRLVETLVIPAEAPTQVRSISRSTWEPRSLFGGAIKTYHPIVGEHFTCKNGQTELGATACTASSAAAYTRTTATLSAFPSGTTGGQSGDAIWQPTSSLVQTGAAAADGDRQTLNTFVLVSNATSYRFRSFSSTKQNRAGGAWVTFAKTAKTWDATYMVALTDDAEFAPS